MSSARYDNQTKERYTMLNNEYANEPSEMLGDESAIKKRMRKNIIKDLILLVLGIAALAYVIIGHIKAERLEERCQVQTEGVIVSEYKGGKGWHNTVVAKYNVNGVTYQTEGIGTYYRSDIGKPIAVYYNAEVPSEAYTGTGAKEPNYFYPFAGISLIVAISVWSLFNERKLAESDISKEKHKE